MPVRNEDWVLGLSARVALMWCDEIILWMHACEDRSPEIALEVRDETAGDDARVRIFFQEKPEWDEMTHRQRMLEEARKRGATHIAIVDADEVLTGNLIPQIGGAYTEPRRLPVTHCVAAASDGKILELPGYNLRGSLNQYHANGLWGNRWFSVAFADRPELHWGGDRFHHREPMGHKWYPYKPIEQGAGGVMHLWGASERRLKAKHAMYKVTERLRFPMKPVPKIDVMYSLWRSECDGLAEGFSGARWKYAAVPDAWWAPYAHLMKYLNVDAEPWQEAEVRRLVARYGAEHFRGLDLFGVA